MLKGLSNVDWGALEHAYGAASDTPDALRALLSQDPSVQDAAMDDLWSSLCHQGTIYEASLQAVPFLLELLAAPETTRKAEILLLLVGLADGGFPDRFDVAAGRLLSELDTPDARREVAERRHLPGRLREAVCAGRDIYLALLTADAREDRSAALRVLTTACTGDDDGSEIASALRRRSDAESDRLVRAALVRFLAAFRPLDKATQAFLADIRTRDPDPLARLAAAAALAYGMGESVPVEVEDSLVSALGFGEPGALELYSRVVSYDEVVDGTEGAIDLAIGLRQMGERSIATAAPRLERLLATRCAEELRTPPRGGKTLRVSRSYVTPDGARVWRDSAGLFIFPQTLALDAADILLTLCFGDWRAMRGRSGATSQPARPITSVQRRALQAVADCRAIWRFPQNVADMLYRRELPDTQRDLQGYLAMMDAEV